MAYGFLDIASTPAVKAAQEANGVRKLWADFKGHRAFDRFTENEARYIAERDSLFIATVSESGWPYVQHRGGAPGFLTVIDDRTLAFPDFRGNRQYISLGNLSANDKAALILMDYPNRRRLKIFGHIEVKALAAVPEVAARFAESGYGAKVERVFLVHLEAFDWNCHQHITPRFSEAELAPALAPLRAHLEKLEAENKMLRERLAALGVTSESGAPVHDSVP